MKEGGRDYRFESIKLSGKRGEGEGKGGGGWQGETTKRK